MAKLTYKELLTVKVGETSRAAMLDIARAAGELDPALTDESFVAELNTLILLASPVAIEYKDARLDKGKHTIELDDDAPFTVELPLTRAVLDRLPVSLHRGLMDAAWAANPWANDWLKKSVEMTMNSARQSGAGSSAEPTEPAPAPTKTTGESAIPTTLSSG